MTKRWPMPDRRDYGECSWCGEPAELFPSGRWAHLGPSCDGRNRYIARVGRIDAGVLSFPPRDRPPQFMPAPEETT